LTTPENRSADERAENERDLASKPTLPGKAREAVTAVAGWLAPDAGSLEQKSSNELAEIRTDLAVSRNLMAADRTLMAWIRTALSMDSFGFTIYKLLETYAASGGHLPEAHSPRNIGLFLTGMGTLAMVMGAIEYWQSIKELRHLKEVKLARPTFVMGIAMALMGLFLFFAIIAKLF
jgi:putative membrane protein